jgi:hypothetical protein
VRVKNITDSSLSSDWVPGGEIAAGETVEVPDAQPDGSPLLWPAEYFEVVAEKKSSKAKAEEA